MFIHFWNYVASTVFAWKSVSKRPCTFITVIMQIRTFSLNLNTSNKNFETKNIPWKYVFKSNKNIKKFCFQNFSEKHCVLTLTKLDDDSFVCWKKYFQYLILLLVVLSILSDLRFCNGWKLQSSFFQSFFFFILRNEVVFYFYGPKAASALILWRNKKIY